MNPEEDRLPKHLYQKLQDSGKVITETELKTMIQDYYQLHGWDEQGIPPPLMPK